VIKPLPLETLAWLRHAASCGQRDSQAMLHLLERMDAQEARDKEDANRWASVRQAMHRLRESIEALEQRPIPGTVELAAPTIRDYCAALNDDVDYLLTCIEDGSSDPITLQEISDLAETARAALAAEPAGEVPTPAEIDKLTWQHASDLSDFRIGIAPEDVPALVYAALARWGRAATPSAPEVGEVGEVGELVAYLQDHGT